MKEAVTSNTTKLGQRTRRAWAYLRVSSDGQVQTGYSPDGLSISAQKERAEDKAARHEAKVVRFWGDPGKSAFKDLHKRREFLEMLDELKRCNQREGTRIDYVIVYAIDRWARNIQDHFRTRELVREAGATLLSVTEPMLGEDTPEAFYFEGLQAVNAEYESRKTSRRVRGGILQKAKEGGAHGPAKLGYLNDVEHLLDGRRVPCVVFDPERATFITHAFRLFASGLYSLSGLSNELYGLGLRSRPTRRHPSSIRKVKSSTLQRLLRDPYYLGLIPYKRGTPDQQIFPGRHEPLIDEETFQKVQALLDENRVSGERTQKHHHYLKGSVFCGECGRRLLYGPSRNQAGNYYDYFFCGSRIRGKACPMRRNFRPKLIEDAIQRYYVQRPVQLTLKDVAKRTKAIEALVAVSQQASEQVKAAKTELIDKLEGQQARLLQLYEEESGETAPGAFRKELKRLDKEIEAAKNSLAVTENQLSLDGTLLRMALELAGAVAKVYRTAPNAIRRGYNQAFFKKLLVKPEQDETGKLMARVVETELTEPFKVLLAQDFEQDALIAAGEVARESCPETRKRPRGFGAAFWQSLVELKPRASGSLFDPEALGGEGGIRTLERACAPYSLSRRVPSATRPPLRGRKP